MGLGKAKWAYSLLCMPFLACTGAGGCNSGSMGQAVPGAVDRSLVDQNVVQARLSPEGFDFLEQDLEGLVQAALGHGIKFKVPKTRVGETSWYLCAEDGCDAEIDIKDGSLQIVRREPVDGISTVDIEARIDLKVNNVLTVVNESNSAYNCRIDIAYQNHFSEICKAGIAGTATSAALASDWSKATCDQYCAQTSPAPGRLVRASIAFGVDPQLGHPTLSVNDVQVTLGNSKLHDGAGTSERCPAIADVRPVQYNKSTTCAANDEQCRLIQQTQLNNAPGICFATQLGSDSLTTSMQAIMHDAGMHALKAQLADILSTACTHDSQCPTGTACQETVLSPGWSCTNGKCLLPEVRKQVCARQGAVVPPLLGVEVKQDLGTFAPNVLTDTNGPVSVIAGLGGTLSNERNSGGLVTSGFFGVETARSRCVAPRSRPQRRNIEPINLSEEARVFDGSLMREINTSYHGAISVHRDMLNQLAWAVYTNGAMCLTLEGTQDFAFDSQALGLLISSIGELYGEQKAPAYINIVPTQVPEFSIGRGQLRQDGDRRIVDDPHLEVTVTDLDIEFYSMLADRYVRLFTLRIDYKVGVFFDFNAHDELLPLLGNAVEGANNIEVLDVELLGNDVQDLEKVIPRLLGFALPVVTEKVLKPIKLPTSDLAPGYRFRMLGMSGEHPTNSNGRFDFLTGYGRIERASAAREIPMPTEARAEVVQVGEDSIELSLDVVGDEPTEFSYRIDNGLFSTFTTARTLRIQRPSLAATGQHRAEIIARRVGKRETLSAEPTLVSFVMKPGVGSATAGPANMSATRAIRGGAACSQSNGPSLHLALLAFILLQTRRTRRF